MNSLSFDIVKESEETLLAGLGLEIHCRFSEYDPGIAYTFLCSVQADVLVVSSTRRCHSMDLSPNVGAFGFRRFWILSGCV